MKSKDEIQQECLTELLKYNRAGAALSMGIGKTFLCLKHMNTMYTEHCRFLVVAPSISILNTWVDEARKHNMLHLLPHIDRTTYISLHKRDLDYDVVYFDEAHTLKESHIEWLNNYKGNIIGVTGTPPNPRNSKRLEIMNRYYPIKYKYLVDQAISDSLLNDYQIVVHKLSLDERKNIRVEKGKAVWFTSEKADYDYWTNRVANATSQKDRQITSIMRMKSLQKFKSKEVVAKIILDSLTNKTILFANTQEQADSFGIPSYHSSNPDSEENLTNFKAGRINKLSCVLQLNEGVNIPELKESIILHSYGNEKKLSQRLGRTLRLNPDDTATIHVLTYRGTIDEQWVYQALADFDKNKVKTIEHDI